VVAHSFGAVEVRAPSRREIGVDATVGEAAEPLPERRVDQDMIQQLRVALKGVREALGRRKSVHQGSEVGVDEVVTRQGHPAGRGWGRRGPCRGRRRSRR